MQSCHLRPVPQGHVLRLRSARGPDHGKRTAGEPLHLPVTSMIGSAQPEELAAALERGDAVIDVRTPEEFAAGHVPGALFLPLFSIPLRMSELNRNEPVYIVCESGGRSMQAGQYLHEHGYQVINLMGGMAGWRAQGRPVETGLAAP